MRIMMKNVFILMFFVNVYVVCCVLWSRCKMLVGIFFFMGCILIFIKVICIVVIIEKNKRNILNFC